MPAEITRHGGKRARERIGIPKRAVQRRAEQALAKGTERRDTTGSLREYLDILYRSENGKSDEIRVLSGYIYIFCEKRLLTVLVLPKEYQKRRKTHTDGEDNDG